jgi:paraquat-inducible protein B
MLKKLGIIVILPLFFMGCKENAHHIKVKYDQIYDLKKGERVLFEQNHIGQVTEVFYSKEGYYLVSLAIKKSFANAATEHSRFIIIVDPQDKKNKAIEIIQAKKGGAPLQEGAIVDGSTKSSEFFGPMRDELDKGIENLKEQFDKFSEEIKRIPESDEFKKLKKELDVLLEELKKSGKSVKEKIEKQLLPQIEKEVEKLRERLREFEQKKESKPNDDQLKKTAI